VGMAVSADTAESLIKELYLMGRAIRLTLLHPEEGDLLPGGVAVLGTLESRGPGRQGDLAADMCMSPSALSRHVAELVGAGYIGRRVDPSDGRASLVHVTDEGRDLLQRVRITRARALQAVLAEWSDDEAEQACDVVQKLRNSLAAHAQRVANGQQQVSKESQEVDV